MNSVNTVTISVELYDKLKKDQEILEATFMDRTVTLYYSGFNGNYVLINSDEFIRDDISKKIESLKSDNKTLLDRIKELQDNKKVNKKWYQLW